MEEERKTYKKHGTEDEWIVIQADELLAAIAEGKGVDIEYAIIEGDLYIDWIAYRLKQAADGKWLIERSINIRYSRICGHTHFGRANIYEGYPSHDTIFAESIVFRNVTFDGDVDFSYSTFSGTSDFEHATFDGSVNFRYAIFNRHAFFSRIICNKDVDFSYARFITDEVAFDEVRMEFPAVFYRARLRENIVWAGLWNEIVSRIIRRIVWLLTVGKIKLLLPWIRVTEVESFNTTTAMDGSSNPYLKRYIEDEQWIKSWRYRSKWRRFLFYCWEATCHCGRSFILWLCWIILIAILFGAVYADYTVPSWVPGPMKSLLVSIDPKVKLSTAGRTPTRFTPYYFSIVTFTTLGFGDIEPQGLAGEIWLALEVVLGYVMLGGLISIFANKFARRS